MCEQFVCQRAGTNDISDQKLLQYGKGYALAGKEFDERLRSIIQMNYGLIIISHAEQKKLKNAANVEYNHTGPTVNKRGAKIINRMADIIGYVQPISQIDPATNLEKVKTYMFMRGNSSFTAGSRFKHMVDCIEFSYDNLVSAIHDAIDKSVLEYGDKYLQESKNNLYIESSSEKTFEEVILEFDRLIQELINNGVSDSTIFKITESYLGTGNLVKNCTSDQLSLIELINGDLAELLNSAAQ